MDTSVINPAVLQENDIDESTYAGMYPITALPGVTDSQAQYLCVFRPNMATHSGTKWPPILILSGQRFWN